MVQSKVLDPHERSNPEIWFILIVHRSVSEVGTSDLDQMRIFLPEAWTKGLGQRLKPSVWARGQKQKSGSDIRTENLDHRSGPKMWTIGLIQRCGP